MRFALMRIVGLDMDVIFDTGNNMKICVLIPAYNEGDYIYDVVCRCQKHIDNILVYNDGSTDNTVAEAERAGAEVVGREKNKGKGQTLLDGFDLLTERGFDGIIALDADGQHLPEELPLFIEAANAGADIVIGNRMAEKKTMPTVNWYTNVITSLVISMLARKRIHDSQVGYRFVSCKVWKALKDKIVSRNFEFEGEMLVVAGRQKLNIVDVPIETVYGTEVSKINPWLDTWRFIKMATRLLVS